MLTIILNGPPRSGKDTVANFISEKYEAVGHRFAGPLKRMCHDAYGLHDLAEEWFDKCKDEPSEHFLGKTPREVYIAFSELYMKPMYGKAIWGELVAKEIATCPSDGLHVVPDGGFDYEIEPVRQVSKVKIIQIRRPGFDFSNDSRDYLSNPDLVVSNSLDVANLLKAVDYHVAKWVVD